MRRCWDSLDEPRRLSNAELIPFPSESLGNSRAKALCPPRAGVFFHTVQRARLDVLGRLASRPACSTSTPGPGTADIVLTPDALEPSSRPARRHFCMVTIDSAFAPVRHAGRAQRHRVPRRRRRPKDASAQHVQTLTARTVSKDAFSTSASSAARIARENRPSAASTLRCRGRIPLPSEMLIGG